HLPRANHQIDWILHSSPADLLFVNSPSFGGSGSPRPKFKLPATDGSDKAPTTLPMPRVGGTLMDRVRHRRLPRSAGSPRSRRRLGRLAGWLYAAVLPAPGGACSQSPPPALLADLPTTVRAAAPDEPGRPTTLPETLTVPPSPFAAGRAPRQGATESRSLPIS